MIFNLWPVVAVKLGDERHVHDRAKLMYTEVAEIEKVTGLSYTEWVHELGRFSLPAVAALLHILRLRDGTPSDYKTMNFAAADLDVVPLHEDGMEFTPEEATADLAKRMEEQAAGVGPTLAAGGAAEPAGSLPVSQLGISPSSLNGSGSAHGSGNGSRTRTSSRAKPTSTAS